MKIKAQVVAYNGRMQHDDLWDSSNRDLIVQVQ